MAMELRSAVTALLNEVYAINTARENCEEPVPFGCPRDLMLMAHGEWVALLEALRLGRAPAPAVLAERAVRLAAVLLKGAADLGEPPPAAAARVAPAEPGSRQDHRYIVAVKSARRPDGGGREDRCPNQGPPSGGLVPGGRG